MVEHQLAHELHHLGGSRPFAGGQPARRSSGGGGDGMGKPISRLPERPEDSPEVARQQAEWQRQVESLDKKEAELHTSQLRLIREQTATFIRDLDSLKQEVESLKASAKHDPKADLRHRELKDALERDKQERQVAHAALHEKVSSLIDKHLPEHKEDLQQLKAQVKSIESGSVSAKDLKVTLEREQEERSAHHEVLNKKLSQLNDGMGTHAQLHQEAERKLEQHRELVEQVKLAQQGHAKVLASSHAEVLSKVQDKMSQMHSSLQSSVGQDKSDLHLKHNSLNDRVDRLERELQNTVMKKAEKMEVDLRELKQAVDNERRSNEARSQQLSHQMTRIEASRDSVHDRLDFLERAIGEHRPQASLTSASRPTSPAGSRAGSPKGARRQPLEASLVDRIRFLEQSFADASDENERDSAQVKGKFEHMGSKLSEYQSHFAHQGGLQERVNRVEKLVSEGAESHAEALASAHSKLENLGSRVQTCERQGSTLGELQKSHANLAADTTSRNAQHVASLERIVQLEGSVSTISDRHGADLDTLKAAHAKHEVLHSKHSKEVDALKNGQATQATLAERLKNVEQAMATQAHVHSKHASDAHGKLEDFHGRLATCEAHATQVGDVKKALAGVVAEKAVLHGNHASLKDRVDYLENMLGDSAVRHTKAVESAHTKLEQMSGRLTACERLGGHVTHSVTDLQRGHAELANDRSEHTQKHASMQERLDYLEKVLGDSADKHAREVEALKTSHSKHIEEVRNIKASNAQHATLNIEERLSYIEKRTGDHGDTHERDLAGAHAKMDQLHNRIAQCERTGAAVTDLKRSHTGLASEKAQLDSAHATMKERMDYLERLMGDSAEKHAKAVEETRAKAEGMHKRLAACEKHGETVTGLQRDHEDHKRDHELHKGTVQERLQHLEYMIADVAERHSKEVEAVKGTHNRMASDHKAQHGRLGEQVAQEREARNIHHAAVQEKIKHLEERATESNERHESHAKALEAQKTAHAKLSVEATKQDSQHASALERAGRAEALANEHAARHREELTAAHCKVDQLAARLDQDRSAKEALVASLENVKKAHASLSTEKAATEQKHAAVGDKVEQLARLLSESAEKHTMAVDALKAAHAKLETDTKAQDSKHQVAAEKFGQLAREKENASAHHASLKDRVEYLERKIGDSADQHAKELEAVRNAHHKQIKELDGVKKAQSFHATVQDRLDYIEKRLGDSVDKHAEELAAAHAKIDHMRGKVSEEKIAREKHHTGASESLKQELSKREKDHHASVDERLIYLEGLVGDSADKHTKDLDSHKAEHSKLVQEVKAHDSQHSSLGERISYLETLLHDSAENHAKELAAAAATMDQVHSKVVEERSVREQHHMRVARMISQDKEAGDSKHAEVHTRLEHVEALVSEHSERHARELLESHKVASSRMVTDMKGRDTHHASVNERLDHLEKVLLDTTGQHGHSLESVEARLEQAVNRIAGCERQLGSAVGELKAQKQKGQALVDKSHADHIEASMKDRIAYLETVMGDSAGQHSKAMEAMRIDHSKLAAETRAHGVHHSTVGERLTYLEGLLHEQAERHEREVGDAHKKADQLHGRVVACETHGSLIENLKKSHASLVGDKGAHTAQLSVTADKVEHLENAFRDALGRHSQDLQAAHSKIQELHSNTAKEVAVKDSHHKIVSEHLGNEKEARERHQATMEERVARLESRSSSLSDQHSRDLEHAHGNIQHRLDLLEQKVSDELKDVREHVHGERQVRGQHHDAVAEHLEAERRARDQHEKAVQNHLLQEKKAREAHELLVKEHFGHEKSERERNHVHVQETLAREKEAREKHVASHKDILNREAQAREATSRDTQGMLQKEREAREKHQRTVQDHLSNHLHKERSNMEEVLTKERAERGRHHETVHERMETLQRMMVSLEAVVRKDTDERAKEAHRLWQAIDGHTHDVSDYPTRASAAVSTARPRTRSPPSPTAPPANLTMPSGHSAAYPPTVTARPAYTPAPALALAASRATSAEGKAQGLRSSRSLGTFHPAALMPPPISCTASVMPAPAPAAAVPVVTVAVTSQLSPQMGHRAMPVLGAPFQSGFRSALATPASGSLFDQLDTNHDGIMSRAEFSQLQAGIGRRP
mmetsp:Transcript_139137/g.444470  ORF Transcript_139137/g.444470 Transcript_139137/m.444470 type:complete len:2115 (+) Transcript_139137:85-6429(+)